MNTKTRYLSFLKYNFLTSPFIYLLVLHMLTQQVLIYSLFGFPRGLSLSVASSIWVIDSVWCCWVQRN